MRYGLSSLPQSEKAKISRTDQNPWGFFDQELTKNTPDWKEIFDYGPEYGDTHRPVWPERLPEFKQAVEAFYLRCETLAFELTEVIGAVLGAPAGTLSNLFQPEHTSFVRANYYPVCPNPESPADISTPMQGHQGINHHTDSGLLTILLQDAAPGLEIYKAGSWHLVEPLADALVVNIGDIAQVLSNDRYHAALHRVRASSTSERCSVPFFFNPSYSAITSLFVQSSRWARGRFIRRSTGESSELRGQPEIMLTSAKKSKLVTSGFRCRSPGRRRTFCSMLLAFVLGLACA